MTPEQKEVLVQSSYAFTRLTSFAKNNQAIRTPDPLGAYEMYANALMDIVREK